MNKPVTIIALHGFTGGGADFSGFANQVKPHATWLCPDLPGHGPDPLLPCDPARAVKLIEENYPQTKATPTTQLTILLGYSMGARAALMHACKYPSRWDALVLISCNPGIEGEEQRQARREADEALAHKLEKSGSAPFIQEWQEQGLIRSQQNIRPDWYAAMQATRALHSAEGLAKSLKEFGQGSCPNHWPSLAHLKMPVLLLSGSLDDKYDAIARSMNKQIEHAQHTTIEGAGHMPHLEGPEATAARLSQFIDGL